MLEKNFTCACKFINFSSGIVLTLTQNQVMNSLYYFYKQSLFLTSLITESIPIASSSFLATSSGHSISACWLLKSLLLRALGPSCIARYTTLKITIKPSSSTEVRNIVVQGIFGSSLTYISHD